MDSRLLKDIEDKEDFKRQLINSVVVQKYKEVLKARIRELEAQRESLEEYARVGAAWPYKQADINASVRELTRALKILET